MASVPRKRIPRGRTWALDLQEARSIYLLNYQTHQRFVSDLDFFEKHQHSYIGKRMRRTTADGTREWFNADWPIVTYGPDKFLDIDYEVEQIDSILAMELEPPVRVALEAERAERVAAHAADPEWQLIRGEKDYVAKLDKFMSTWRLDLLDSPEFLVNHGIQLRPPSMREVVHGWVIDRFWDIDPSVSTPSWQALMPMPNTFKMTYPVSERIDFALMAYEPTVRSIVAKFEQVVRRELGEMWESAADDAAAVAESDSKQDHLWFADSKPKEARDAEWLFDVLIHKKPLDQIHHDRAYARRRVLDFAARLGIDKMIVFPKDV